MSLTLTWHQIAFRLALAVLARTLIGLDRGERGRPAGLRTTLLVCLAAAVAMIQTNLLLITTGKSSDSFAVLDLMRLPLGILTGMGFIGGGVSSNSSCDGGQYHKLQILRRSLGDCWRTNTCQTHSGSSLRNCLAGSTNGLPQPAY